jgi:hypothetical protein
MGPAIGEGHRNRLGFGAMSPHSYAALLNEIAKMRDEIEDLRASAIAWRELYEASAKRCAELEKLARRLGGPIRPPRKRRGPIQ